MIVNLISTFLELSLPIKIFVSSLTLLIAGPGFLYILTEYATYFYIVSLGIRPPFEGVAYLSATVAFLSLVLALCAAVIFIITRFVIGGIGAQIVDFIKSISLLFDEGLREYHREGGKLFHKLSFSNYVGSIEKLPFKSVIGLAFVFFLLILGIVNIVGVSPEADAKGVIMYFTLYTTIALFTLWSKAFSLGIAIIFVLLFYISSINFLLDSERYKEFLQIVGYGGGIPIEVEYKNDSIDKSLKLVIRTSTSLLAEQNKVGKYVEIPIENIKKIIYKKHTINNE